MSRLAESRVGRIERQVAGVGAGGTALAPPARPGDILEFALSEQFLNLPLLYPRQATVLKLVTLRPDLLTDFDREVIAEWGRGFSRTTDERWQGWVGSDGTPADIYERIERCKADGRDWFREVVLVAGRRAGKGFLGAVLFAWMQWWYLTLDDPQAHFGISPTKTLSALVFASRKDQALENQHRDIVRCILNAPCFEPYVAQNTTGTLGLWSHQQVAEGQAAEARAPAFEISGRDATQRGGRGPSAYYEAFDEMAFMQATGANRSAAEIYDSATPALDQCRGAELIYSASSPWAKTGRFYGNYQRALEAAPAGAGPLNHDMVAFQFNSWELYRDWELTGPGGIEIAPGRGPFPRVTRAIQTLDEGLLREELANPETFRVERRGLWATSSDAYLDPKKVSEAFGPWKGAPLLNLSRGQLEVRYFAHGDPAFIGDNFAFAIAHAERDQDSGLEHATFDHLHVWKPQDFDSGQVDYAATETAIFELICNFRLDQITFDQHAAVPIISSLERLINEHRLEPAPNLVRRPESLTRNWASAEAFKRYLNECRVHLPAHALAEAELQFLERNDRRVAAPTTGEVRTDDLADCIIAVTAELLGTGVETHNALQNLDPVFGHHPGTVGPGDDIWSALQGGDHHASGAAPRVYRPGATRGGGWT